MVAEIDPEVKLTKIHKNLISQDGFNAVKNADYVFGCVDDDGPRLVLTELCAAYKRPYFDLASQIFTVPTLQYGGRVCFSDSGQGCLMCLGEINVSEAQDYLASKNAKKDKQMLYGLPTMGIRDSGPSVVTLNGVVASLAATEFMVHAAQIRRAR